MIELAALYVYDIRFDSKRGGKDWRAVFEIRSDSDDNGQAGASDSPAARVAITVDFCGLPSTTSTVHRQRSKTSSADRQLVRFREQAAVAVSRRPDARSVGMSSLFFGRDLFVTPLAVIANDGVTADQLDCPTKPPIKKRSP